jgi:CheY-like chemotaxis protein
MAHVLVVDDDPAVQRLLERIIRNEGHDPVVVASGREALGRLVSATFDLIITDINMPDVDGIELILAVRESGHDMPIIAISGGGLIPADSLLQDARALGAIEIVSKPFPIAEMGDVIQKHLVS